MLQDRVRKAYTFDDVLLEPGHSKVLPSEVDVSTRLTQRITAGVPIMSAAMDTVTESRLAIATAQAGGIGIVHKKMAIEDQAKEVDRVKRSQSGMVVDPITLAPHQPISMALEIMSQYRISGVPITDDGSPHGKLVGILTNRDLQFDNDPSRLISELMTHEDDLITVMVETTLEERKQKLHENRIEKLLVVDHEGHLKGLVTIKDIRKNREYPKACKDHLGRLRVGAAIGTSKDTFDRAAELVKAGVDLLVIDTAHGHSQRVMDVVEKVRNQFQDIDIIAGNIATAEAAVALAEIGVDAVKVGIGAGSICITRVVAGIGIPMMTAISDCAQALRDRGFDIPVIADGGMRYSGDITKALAAGAESVMLGNLLAGTDEAPGEIILYQGRSFKEYRGMGSIAAMRERHGSRDRYSQGNSDEFDLDQQASDKLVAEGVVGRVAHKGTVGAQMHQLVGGLRAGMGYVGAARISELWNARFVQITAAGVRESHVHDVIMTEETPNYRVRN